MEALKKVKIEVSNDPEIPLLGIYTLLLLNHFSKP